MLKKIYILMNFALCDINKVSFNLLDKNLIFQSKKLENKKKYYNNVVNNLLPISINLLK